MAHPCHAHTTHATTSLNITAAKTLDPSYFPVRIMNKRNESEYKIFNSAFCIGLARVRSIDRMKSVFLFVVLLALSLSQVECKDQAKKGGLMGFFGSFFGRSVEPEYEVFVESGMRQNDVIKRIAAGEAALKAGDISKPVLDSILGLLEVDSRHVRSNTLMGQVCRPVMSHDRHACSTSRSLPPP